MESVEFDLNVSVLAIKGTWKPSDDKRNAAWELYVELATRIAVVPLNPGLLREAPASLYSQFATTRGILRKYGPAVARPRPEGEYKPRAAQSPTATGPRVAAHPSGIGQQIGIGNQPLAGSSG